MAYCDSFDKYAEIVTTSEAVRGTSLDDNPLNPVEFGNPEIWLVKSKTAQADLESYLMGRFDLAKLRASNVEFLIYAHAIITWWHMEINGKGRDLVEKKFNYVIKRLSTMQSFATDTGEVLNLLSNNLQIRPKHFVGHTVKDGYFD